jgi:hypothetical protein
VDLTHLSISDFNMDINKLHLKQILLALLIFFLTCFYLQDRFKLIPESLLTGAVEKAERDSLTLQSWFDADFQKKQEAYLNSTFGFSNTLVRLKNQINYSLFNKTSSHGTKLIIGNDGGFIEEEAINSFIGKDRIPDSIWINKLKLIEDVQKGLSERNVKILFCLMPTKAYFDSLNIPSRYVKTGFKNTNYSFLKNKVKDFNINFIDLGQVCDLKIDKSKYSVFPKYGGHWSSYTMYIVMDTIMNKMEKMIGFDEYGFKLLNIEKGYFPICRENDLSAHANLLFEPKEDYYLRPVVAPTGAKTWSILIGDSYLANIVQEEKYDGVFNQIRFWYYFNSEYGAKITYRGSLDELKANPDKLLGEVSKYSLILFVQTDANLNLGFDFFETIKIALDKH